MYSMKNGILFKDEKPVFVLGVSYYPSFLPGKCPVPEDGDRIGEMKHDLKRMEECGFNFLRTAALGDITLKDDNIEVHTDFIDAMLREAERNNLAVAVRLQGYTLNLRNHTNYQMITNQGTEMDDSQWDVFLRSSFFHKGMMEDNALGTKALARHFAGFKNLVAFQTYNEPHYPGNEICDYHMDTITAYRKWLVKKNIITQEKAEKIEPPTERPQKDESPMPWINWRLFSVEAMANFLNDSAGYAKAVCPDVASMTCLVNTVVNYGNGSNCSSYFEIAEKMDLLGITFYINVDGMEVFQAGLVLDNAESAAAVYGKHMHIMEYDARCDIHIQKFNRETYLAIGAGVKGIVYYQWRGDQAAENAPEINGFGFLNNDGTETKCFEEKIKMVKFIAKMSDYIVKAEKFRSGVAILYSDYAYMYTDAIENGARPWGLNNSYKDHMYMTYRELRQKGITVDFLQAEHLADNPLETKVLYVSDYERMSEDEKAAISEFAKGHDVYIQEVFCGTFGYDEFGRNRNVRYEASRNIQDTLDMSGIIPLVQTDCSDILIGILKGDNYYVIAVNNTSTVKSELRNINIRVGFGTKRAVMYTPNETITLRMENGGFIIPKIIDGALIIFEL